MTDHPMTTELLPCRDTSKLEDLIEHLIAHPPFDLADKDKLNPYLVPLFEDILSALRARPALSADAVALAGKLKILSPEVGREPNKAAYDYNVALLESFRQQTWAAGWLAGRDAAADYVDNTLGNLNGKMTVGVVCNLIRSLTPLERKEG